MTVVETNLQYVVLCLTRWFNCSTNPQHVLQERLIVNDVFFASTEIEKAAPLETLLLSACDVSKRHSRRTPTVVLGVPS